MPYGFGPSDPSQFAGFNVLGGSYGDQTGAMGGFGPGVSSMESPNAMGGMPALPGMPGAATGVGGGGFLNGFGMPEAQMALGGLETIGKLWGAWQSAKLAKKQFKFTRDITNTNLANQIRAYNTQLEDRSRSRAVVEGQSPQQAQDYIDRNKAVRG